MDSLHKKLSNLIWYNTWHNHPRHQHAHWFGLFLFSLLTAVFLSVQIVYFYIDKDGYAQAQTTLPAANHQILMAYYITDGTYKDEVKDFVNAFLVDGDVNNPSTFDASINTIIGYGQNHKIILWGGSPSQWADIELNAVKNHWNSVAWVYLDDEPNWDKATAEQAINNYRAKVTALGLPQKPIGINFTESQLRNNTGYQASNLDYVGFEAYMDPNLQNDPTLIQQLNTKIDQMKAIIGNKQMFIVVQGYDRNFTWTNLNSLQAMQTPPYLKAYNDPNVVALMIFSWGRGGGTRALGPCISTEHKRIWGAITGGNQPASVPCSGGTITPSPSISPTSSPTPSTNPTAQGLQPCDPNGTYLPGYMVLCDFYPSVVAPGGTVQISGVNLGDTVSIFYLGTLMTVVTGSLNASATVLTFTVPSHLSDADYSLSVEGDVIQTNGTIQHQTATITGVLTVSSVPIPPPSNPNNPPPPPPPFSPSVGITIPSASNFQDLINNAVTYSFIVVGIAVFIMIMWAGFLWMTSAANPANIATAKRYIFNAIIGAILLLSSYVILNTINPELVGGGFNLSGLNSGVTGQSLITQPTCDNGFCSNNSSLACVQNTDCNTICINNVCTNGAIGACTLDTDCQQFSRFITENEIQSASAFDAGCSRVYNVGYQDFSAVECPPSATVSLDSDPVLQLQDQGANQQIGATAIQTSGNRGQGTRIVILDTGYNYSHPELQSGYLGGWDFINNDNDPMDDNGSGAGSPGHGSHVAGIITADGIDPRAIGVAPDSRIIAGKILDSVGKGNYSTVVSAIYWAINGPDGVYGTSDDFDPDAINVSIGGGAYPNICDNTDATSREMSKAIQYARDHGTLVVMASGNIPAGVSLPGCLNDSFTVGAVDSNDSIAAFSGLGAGVDIVAPGVNLYSSLLGNSYGVKSGTSMATPVVSGLIALIKSAFPNYTVDEVERTIINSAKDLGPSGKDAFYGWGRVDASAIQGIGTCSGICANITATPASCTKNVTASNPNCSVNLNYNVSGISLSELIINKNGVNLVSPTVLSGSLAEPNQPAGIYTYTLNNKTTGAVLATTVVNIYNQGSLSSSWLACAKGINASNLNCDVTLNYTLGASSGNATIYKDGLAWRPVSPPSGAIIDPSVSIGTHTYTLRDSSVRSTQTSRIVVRIEGAPGTTTTRIVASLSPSSVRVGQTITIRGNNLGNQLEVARRYFTVQVHDKNRSRYTTIGTLDPSNTWGTWTVDPDLLPGEHTIRVGPTLNSNDISNEINFTVLP